MPLISQETIDKIRDNVRISDAFEWLGEHVNAKRTMAFCPFCSDKESRHPSCSIDDSKGLFYCFQCHRGGTIFTFVQEHEKCTFGEACEMLAKQFKIPIAYGGEIDEERESRKRHLYDVMERMNEIFVSQRGQDGFKEFVEQRHLSDEAIERFELGYSRYRFADAAVKRMLERFSEDDLVDAGLCYKRQDGKLMLFLLNRVTFPVRDMMGRIVAFGGRDVTGKSKSKYKNSPDTIIFKKGNVLYGLDKARTHISKARNAILCEGYMDTIALQTHGFPQTIGAMGTAITKRNMMYLAKMANTLYVSLDSDAAGVNAAMRTTKNMPESMSMDIRVVSIPRDVAKDPDEFFNERGRTSEDFEMLLDSAQPIFTFCVDTMLRQASDDIERLMSEPNGSVINSNRIRDTRMSCERLIADFIGDNWDKIDTPQRRELAESVALSMRSGKTYMDIISDWELAAHQVKSGASRRYDDAGDKVPQDRGFVFESSSTRNEDLLIGTLYYNPSVRGSIKNNIGIIDEAFTSPVRRSLFDKLNRVIADGKAPNDVQSVIDDNEANELSRIIMSKAIQERQSQLGESTVASLCNDIVRKHVKDELDSEMNKPDLNLDRIFELQEQLGKLQAQ